MKIIPPKLRIEPKEPFKDALFDRKAFGESLTSLLRKVSENLVIVVNAPWGDGKTTFAEMWRADLKGQGLEVIYFDAYAADYFDDPFVSFSGEILALVKKRLAGNKGVPEREAFKKAAVETGKRITGLAVKIGLRAATMGILDSADIKALKEIGPDLASGVSEIGSNLVERRLDEYLAEKDSMKVFKDSLAKLAAVMREEQKFPLTIIVDELDRCRPDFALGLLERIKHLFDVDNVAFVLLVNRAQIESYIETVYGSKDARGYLLKFANLFVDLPNQSERGGPAYIMGRDNYSNILFRHYDLSAVQSSDYLRSSMSTLVDHFGLTLREIEKSFVILAVFYASLPKGQAPHPFITAMLAVLRVKQPSLYEKLRNSNITSDEFFTQTNLRRVSSRSNDFDADWSVGCLRCCFLTRDELEAVARTVETSGEDREDNQEFRRAATWFLKWRYEPQGLIRHLCAQMDRFSVNLE
jgi:hypothetical protein